MAQARSGSRNGDDLGDAAHPATDQMASLAHDTVDRVAGAAATAENRVRGAAARTAEQARAMQEEARAAADEGVRKTRSYIEANPVLSAGIAFAAGVILSSLLRR
jgi:ElaB/YqjD/DUF883 family membrane-anchored ribosome-binding protein